MPAPDSASSRPISSSSALTRLATILRADRSSVARCSSLRLDGRAQPQRDHQHQHHVEGRLQQGGQADVHAAELPLDGLELGPGRRPQAADPQDGAAPGQPADPALGRVGPARLRQGQAQHAHHQADQQQRAEDGQRHAQQLHAQPGVQHAAQGHPGQQQRQHGKEHAVDDAPAEPDRFLGSGKAPAQQRHRRPGAQQTGQQQQSLLHQMQIEVHGSLRTRRCAQTLRASAQTW
jgi:hypothetical protein